MRGAEAPVQRASAPRVRICQPMVTGFALLATRFRLLDSLAMPMVMALIRAAAAAKRATAEHIGTIAWQHQIPRTERCRRKPTAATRCPAGITGRPFPTLPLPALMVCAEFEYGLELILDGLARWAAAQGIAVSPRGRISAEVVAQYEAAQPG